MCAAVAAIEKHLLLSDYFRTAGTATTISAIDKNKQFLGGSIFPGVMASMNALSSSAAQLPYINMEIDNDIVIGTNSIDSMKSGIILGTASMIYGMIDRYKEISAMTLLLLLPADFRQVLYVTASTRILFLSQLMLLSDGLYALYKKIADLPKNIV